MEERPSYFSILTAEVRYDKRLSASEKVLYSEITALANKEGYCYATNGYFAKLYECTETAISLQIKKLAECGYITLDIEDGYKRKIFIVVGDLKKVNTPLLKKLIPPLKKVNTPPLKKVKDNNTSINNKINNYEKKEEQTDFEEIAKEYEKRFPMTLSSYKAQQLADILDNYGKEATLFAIRESLTANAKNPITYIRSVAMNKSREAENNQKITPQKMDLKEIGRRITEETERARAEGKSMTPEEMKQKVIEEMKRKGMKIVGTSTPA